MLSLTHRLLLLVDDLLDYAMSLNTAMILLYISQQLHVETHTTIPSGKYGIPSALP